jgi:hypothetical protein
VHATSGDLLRRDARRHLHRGSDHLARGRTHDLARWKLARKLLDRPSGGVVRVAGAAEQQPTGVALRRRGQEAQQPRRASEQHRQQATGRRIERAGVADTRLSRRASDPFDDRVARRTDRLVDE